MQQVSLLAKMVDIEKNFGAVQALKKVNLEIRPGEILGLLGDNGAGKSTLVKILAGVFPPDRGEIFFEGKQVSFSSPKVARILGIETVHQALSLVGCNEYLQELFFRKGANQKNRSDTLTG